MRAVVRSAETMRRRGYLRYMQYAGALESDPDSRPSGNHTGQPYKSVTTEEGQQILKSWRRRKENS